MLSSSVIPNVLTIAGSDSGGGAGIQADIKAISATGSYACSIITALTAQNTQSVNSIHSISSSFIAEQFDAIFSDINIHAVKVGMLNNSEIIHVVADKLKQYQPPNIVLDPVMVATSGDLLLKPEAINTLKTLLFPLANCITPNLPEVATLFGQTCPEGFDGLQKIIDLIQLEKKTTQSAWLLPSVLIKGGHLKETESLDILLHQNKRYSFTAKRVNTVNTHGTGCSLSSAIASFLAQGFFLPKAIEKAKNYLTEALIHSNQLNVGKGHGPIHHFFRME